MDEFENRPNPQADPIAETPVPTGAPIERLLDAMEEWGASDLFVCEGKPPAVRLHGSVVPLKVAPTSAQELQSFLEQSVSAVALERFEKTGDLDAGFSLDGLRRFRFNLALQQGRTSLVVRALPSGELTFQELGLPQSLVRMAAMPRGLVLVTGATGSGKSTTLAAMIHHINATRRAHIVTLEEPIEFVHHDIHGRITQREIGVDTVSFEIALRQVVRESPDVILIGEMRDLATMNVALQAALTGHLVLASLHTMDACQTLQRIMSFFPAHQRSQIALDLSLSLQGIVSQRLLPRRANDGRVAAAELLTVTPAASKLIREQAFDDLADLMKRARDPAILTFDQSLLDLYKRDVVDFDTGLAYATNPEEFSLAAQGMQTGVATFHASHETEVASGLDIKRLLGLMEERAGSDLHLSVGRPPMLRVAGHLQPLPLAPLTTSDVRLLLYSVLAVRQRTTYELEKELDFALALDNGQRFRVNAYFERGNMAAAFRAIPTVIPDAETLGLPPVLLDLGDEPHGLLLSVGPTGAGKTTTLACIIDRINHSRLCHIITVEDPIEYTHISHQATIHQREVGADTRSFAGALKYILRQDPDVILVGELRDLETISAALTAAETGHLVLGTLHANDAIQTVDRIVDVFPAHQQEQARSQLAACVLGVVSQRLLRTVDGTGRVAAFEVMIANPAIRTLIRENKMHQATSIMQASRGAQMVTLDQALADLVRQGLVTDHEAARYLRNPQALSGVR